MSSRVPSRGCTALNADGQPCGATRRRDVPYCFLHDPDSSAEASEARRIGGLHRKKEKHVALVYEVTGVRTVDEHERILEIATLDALALESSVARSRTLTDIVRTGLKVREASRLEDRMAALEAALREVVREVRLEPPTESAFDDATRFEERHR
jgi:hypothetical protein